MQLRRILLLFALVLGLSAVVGSLAPPPETEREEEEPALTTPSAGPREAAQTERVRFEAPEPDDTAFEARTRSVTSGSSLELEVAVPMPGDVVVDGLGLRASAHPLAPARFGLLAEPSGRHAVLFLPVNGEPRLVGRLDFER